MKPKNEIRHITKKQLSLRKGLICNGTEACIHQPIILFLVAWKRERERERAGDFIC